jgi:hypothetical protein
MKLLVTDAQSATDVLRAALGMTWPASISPQERASYFQTWAEAYVDHLLTMPGTGRATLLDALLTEFDVSCVDEVDDNPERNPHVGFVSAATSSRLTEALLAWRAGAEPEPSPFAVHIVKVIGQREDGTWDYTVEHDADCDRLPYGQICAFDQVAQGDVPIAPGTEPGEYTAWVVLSGADGAASEEYIHVGTAPIVRLEPLATVEPQYPGPAGTLCCDRDGDLWVTLPNGQMRVLEPIDTDPNEAKDCYGPMVRVGRGDF